MYRIFLTMALCCFFTQGVGASEGVLEINQACAESPDGCFPGDGTGFPIEIRSEIPVRSLRLSGDLNANATAIRIFVNGVSINLNGFAITRGALIGTTVEGVTVRNGSLLNGNIQLGGYSHVENLVLIGSPGNAIQVGNGSQVLGNRIADSSGDGINAGEAAIISKNTVVDAGGNGIEVSAGSQVIGNNIRGSNDFGINFSLESDEAASYGNNVLTDNSDGSVNSGIDVGGNICDTQVCPDTQ